MDNNPLIVFYTYNTIDPHAVYISSHLHSMTLNLHMKYFHSKEMIQGLLLSRLGINASDALIEAILAYPEDVDEGKNVTVMFDVDGFGS